MNEEELAKKLKAYKYIIVTLIGLLFIAIGYSYTLRLDIDYLQNKVDTIENSFIRNINKWIWEHK